MSRKGENIYKRKDGRWEGRYIRERVDGKIKYGYIFAHSYKDAKEKLIHARQKNLTNLLMKTEISNYLFSEISDEWICVNNSNWKESTLVKYTNILNSYLLPAFGEKNIFHISRENVNNYISELLNHGGCKGKGLSPKSVNSIISVMKNIFEYAEINKGYNLINFKGLNTKQIQHPMRILNMNEQQKLNTYLLKNQNDVTMGILISLYTGLRVGELCALKWGDISFEDKCIHINKTMQRLQIKGNPNRKTEILISAPKSECSIRDIPIPETLFEVLKKHQQSFDTYVLTGSKNRYIEPRTMHNKFKFVLKKADIPYMNFHCLRHTFATRCIELGFDIKSLSEILGHASVQITLNRYVHPSMQLKQRNMDMLSELLTVK